MAMILLVSCLWEDHGYDTAGQLCVRGSWLWYCWSVMCERIMAMILLVSYVWEDHGYDIAGQLCVRGSWLWYCWSVVCERIMAMILLVSCLWEDHGCDTAGQLCVRGSWLWYCWSVMCERIMAMILLVSYVWEDHGYDTAGQLLVRGSWLWYCWSVACERRMRTAVLLVGVACERMTFVFIFLVWFFLWSNNSSHFSEGFLLLVRVACKQRTGFKQPGYLYTGVSCDHACVCVCTFTSVFCLHPCTCFINSFRLMQHSLHEFVFPGGGVLPGFCLHVVVSFSLLLDIKSYIYHYMAFV